MFLSRNETEFALVEVNHVFVYICIFTELNSGSKGNWDKKKQWNRALLRCHQSQERLNLDFRELWIKIFWLHWHLVIALRWNLLCSTTWRPGQKMNSDHRWLLRQVQTDKSLFAHALSHLQSKSYMLVHFCACLNKPYFPRQLSAPLRPHTFYSIGPRLGVNSMQLAVDLGSSSWSTETNLWRGYV